MVNRILLADDSITIQKVVNLTFADEGIEVVSVSNGDLAERRLNEVNPDLVLADIFMPGKNGYELCEAIKDSPQFHNVPVVLLVGAFEPFDQAEARRVRADAHMTKPFESRTLVETVRKLINSSAQPRAAAQTSAPHTTEQGERPAEERRPQSGELQALRPDFPAISEQAVTSPPAEGQGATFGFDSITTSQEESLSPLGVHFDAEPYQAEPDLLSQTSWTGDTELLASPAATSQPHSGPLDFAPFEDLAHDAASESSMAGIATGSDDAAARFGGAAQEMVLDLDSPEISLPQSTASAVGFDLSPDPVSDVSISGMRAEASSDWSRSESDTFKTQMLEPPAALSGPKEVVNTNPLERPAALDFNSPGAAHVGSTELQGEDSSSSTLLAVDDPLGDVLMDDRAIDDLSYGASQATQVFFTDEAPRQDFDIEFIPEEETIPIVPEAAASRVTGELTPPGSFTFEEPSDLSIAVEQQAGPSAAPEATVVNDQPFAFNEPVEAVQGFEPLTAPAAGAVDSDEGARWLESGFELRSGDQPLIEEEEGVAEAAGDAPVAEFTSSSMWGEQETRFAPIDIEATPVEDPAPASGMAESHTPETGFEIAPVIDAAPAPAADAAVETEAHVAARGQVETAARPAELSQASIDEIVRRVVSEMTESVVREIAWEVVPDVVERVIKQMARQEVSKRE
jgi:CheY-like chemotaxis protein